MQPLDPSQPRVLGIDPGLRITGWGVIAIDASTPRLLDCGIVAPSTRLPLADRLLCIEQALCEVVKRWQPAAVAIEEPFVAENVRSAMAIGEARAVGLLVAARHGLAASQYSPAEVKQLVTGYGRSDKRQVQSMLCMQLGLPAFESADAADAVAVALCHIMRSRLDSMVGLARGQR